MLKLKLVEIFFFFLFSHFAHNISFVCTDYFCAVKMPLKLLLKHTSVTSALEVSFETESAV